MSPMAAIKAYQAAATGATGPAGGPGEVQGGPGFAELLDGVITNAVNQSRQAEQQMSMAVQGRAELIDVVTAVASAEASLETVMAVRDQVIQAYQEIMRMPI
ncbi:MAG: flagellar hook-basal body complex protein FliE [Brevundimonas sp.]|jgi:flagellar hook-basal body complex protein FliE|uniref:flagellar hook-basal body complex protein FliE n=1 Tax=Brevundimonas sp. TaxID=1871086 RepID=UPI0022C17F43|nr:flagellar hook-basal body complex protein FliE [Brevundimonas sp.]MCZ8087643.1 flagellar hook-basal body complex protein FliE [Brevundimonas sp.]MCZ8194323.1 flagellar hook-basal body complex protein FliE [Brevundimonas sp.]